MEKLNIEKSKTVKTKIIEFIGAPGVGKSTLYKNLRKKTFPYQKWTYMDVLLSPAPPIFEFFTWADYKIRKALKKKIHQSIPVEKGLKYIQQHEALAEFYWTHLSDASFPANMDYSQRFRSIFFLFRDFCRYQAISEAAQDKYCLLDEGLLQKSFLIHDSPKRVSALLDEYLDLIPLPQAVFYVHVDSIPLIMERLQNRHKTLVSHADKEVNELYTDIQRWQMLMKMTVEKIQLLGVKVFPLDGSKPLSYNLVQIKTILNKHL